MLEEKTQHLDTLQLNLLFFYGGQQEITQAIQKIATQVQNGEININEISINTIKDSLWTAGIPDPELIIRTGKVKRLSNFLPYQSTYSELMFIDSFWPETDENLLQNCINEFTGIQRNFGS